MQNGIPLCRTSSSPFHLVVWYGSNAIGSHAQRRHLHKALDARPLRRFHHIARPQMMHALKSICSLFHDDPHQMDHRIAALHAFVQPCAFDYVAMDPLEIIFAPDVLRVGYHTRLLSRNPRSAARTA